MEEVPRKDEIPQPDPNVTIKHLLDLCMKELEQIDLKQRLARGEDGFDGY